MQNPQDAIMWKEAFLGKYYGGKKFRKTDWDQLLGHVEAITDFPGAVFVEELVEAYPDAKVVLTLRDVDDWYRSMQRTIMKQAYSPMATIMGWIDPVCFGEGNRMCRLGFDAMFKGDFDRNGKQAFLDHYNHVRRVVPAENLLEWSPSEGWGPLCTFLEQPIPPTPFPRSNEAVVFQQKSATVIWDSFGRFFMKVTTFGLGIAAAFFAAKYAHSLILP
ncbi:hypothetical protein BDV59DRAFT_200708 [Aspergillus ambiguus]|uniref:sulfotransferase family protein n=1 Tax=Aspergillus ambiguus TaxID=176160 RepID=UPI003CCC914B